MSSKGWICLHRDIQDHWIFDDPVYFKAWIAMLMTVNHKENKALIKGKLLACPRGQSVMSHSSWADTFGKGWNRYKVIRFFKLLESEKMIVQRNECVTTRVTICNYSQYQDKPADERPPKSLAKQPKKESKPEPSDELFNRFWVAYPKKVGKGAALKNFKKLKPSKELVNKMLKSIAATKRTDQWTKDSGKFIPYPQKWLSEERWEDEVESKVIKGGW